MSPHVNTNTEQTNDYDIPLPGNYPCLTLQLNVTRYASGGMGRTVAVLRDPGSNLELARWFHDTAEWPAIDGSARYSFERALSHMLYLQGFGNL